MKSRQSPTGQSGFTVVEVVAALVVFSLGILGAASMFDSGASLSSLGRRVIDSRESTRTATGPLFEILAESKAGSVDTTCRYVFSTLGIAYASDRFSMNNMGIRQCLSPTCSFHTSAALDIHESGYLCAMDHLHSATVPTLRGKQWPGDLALCPLDQSPMTDNVRLDGVRVLSSRNKTGAFVRDQDGKPSWSSMVFIAPRPTKGGLPELVAFRIYASDLNPVGQSYATGSWTQFPAASPTMINLFDFGTDGGLNGVPDGVPDGSLPVCAASADSHVEIFFISASTGPLTDPQGYLVYEKQYSTPGVYPYRYASIFINLNTEEIVFQVSHAISSSTKWEGYAQFTRSPQILARNVTEFVASTRDSLPFDDILSPFGISEDHVVRVVVGTTGQERIESDYRYFHQIDQHVIKPRNR